MPADLGPLSSGRASWLALWPCLTHCKAPNGVVYTVSSAAGTRDRILEAAQACAQTRPDFSMAEVAAGAGFSRQAVYLHFPDRARLLAALLDQVAVPADPTMVGQAPSARAALSALLAGLAEAYPKIWPVLQAAGSIETSDRLEPCRALAARFRDEGALAPHLSLVTATDLLFSLTSPSLWHDLVGLRGWDRARYRSHVGYLATSALTR